MRKIFKWLSREDLNLKSRWWHRLFIVLFICSFVFFVVFQVSFVKDFIFPIPQWEKVNTLEDRIESKLNSIYDMRKPGEVIDDIPSGSLSIDSFSLNNKFKREINEPTVNGISARDIYCSNQIQNHVELIMQNKKLDYFYIYTSDGLNTRVSYDDFIKNISENDIKCLTPDAFSTYDNQGQVINRSTFLRTTDDLFFGKKIQNSHGFYRISSVKTVLYWLVNFIGILLYSIILFYIIIVIYYKVIIYIIFGNKKK